MGYVNICITITRLQKVYFTEPTVSGPQNMKKMWKKWHARIRLIHTSNRIYDRHIQLYICLKLNHWLKFHGGFTLSSISIYFICPLPLLSLCFPQGTMDPADEPNFLSILQSVERFWWIIKKFCIIHVDGPNTVLCNFKHFK